MTSSFFGHVLADVASLFVAEAATWFQQFPEQFFHVSAVGVVVLNQFLELSAKSGLVLFRRFNPCRN
jgi:hypothetical protein